MVTDPVLDDPYLPLAFSLYSNPGAYAVMAGAGVSRGAGLPTAWDIVVDLVAQIAEQSGDGTEITSESAAPWYEKRFGVTPSYSEIVERLALTPTERQSLLKGYFETSAGGEKPGPSLAHRSIAKLMEADTIRVVITMNFDRHIEQALRDLQIEPTIVATESDARGLAPLHTVRHCVIHLHGDYLNAASMRNTATELSGYGRHMTALIRRVISDYGLLVAGWSAEHDTALREAVAANYRSIYTMGWISPGDLSPAALALVTNKNALALKAKADDAFGRLADQVTAMRERRTRHPLSLSVAANRIKRELSGRHVAISSHDVLAAEFEQLSAQPAFHLDRYMDDDYAQYQLYLAQVVEASRIAAGSVAVLSYWGPESALSWWSLPVQRMARTRLLSGTIALIELPLIPAATIFYCAGLAAAAAGRYALMLEIFELRGNKTDRIPRPFYEMLTPAGVFVATEHVTEHHATVRAVCRQALGLGEDAVDEALQTFEVLRLCKGILTHPEFPSAADEYKRPSTPTDDSVFDIPTDEYLRQRRNETVRNIGFFCDPRGAHLIASERIFVPQENRTKWGCAIAEHLAEDVARLGEQHPLSVEWRILPQHLYIALRAVSAAVGHEGGKLQFAATPVNAAGFVPSAFWLDTAKAGPDE
ncbi:SIR2 family protein [Mycobacterium sp.]|uniref:SIR2 family protein n=1 Tax=Mycobacterium sp. TaxID=1785 RepID=UPI00257EE7E6|nr:SIR2 family protein [Mycobacterium sp.]